MSKLTRKIGGMADELTYLKDLVNVWKTKEEREYVESSFNTIKDKISNILEEMQKPLDTNK